MSGKIAQLTPPSAEEYAAAFHGLEDRVMRVARIAEVADYLASLLREDIHAKPKGNHEYLARMSEIAVGEVCAAAKEFDSAYLALHNDLTGRESTSRASSREVQS